MNNTVANELIAGGQVNLTILIHACEEGGFTSECVEIPGCFSEGETEDEAEANIRDAVNACLSVMFEDCLSQLRANVDFGKVDMHCVSKKERIGVQIPQLYAQAFA